jgi:proteasome lid subunit RPN8/RPN11
LRIFGGPIMIILSKELARTVLDEGGRLYPYECCGLVLGEDKGGLRLAKAALIVNNSREGEDKRRRFVIEPEDFLKAEREAAGLGLEVVGIYHSHPDHPAVPSQYDLDHALPFYSYLIVSVEKGSPVDLASWLLKDDRSAFAREGLSRE